MLEERDLIEVGRVVGVRGLKGEIKVAPWCDSPSDYELFETVCLQDGGNRREYRVVGVKYGKGTVALKLEGVDTPEAAQALVGRLTLTRRDYFGELEEGAYFIRDLLGMRVVLESGEELGVLRDVFQTGGNDVYCVKTAEGREVLLPCIQDVVRQIDLERREITVHLLEGLL